jgi:hypothetical protein
MPADVFVIGLVDEETRYVDIVYFGIERDLKVWQACLLVRD